MLKARLALDETFERVAPAFKLDAADAGLARAIAITAFRRLGTIQYAMNQRLDRGSPRNSGLFEPILVAAAAQILFLDVPDHAAVDLAIRQLHEDPRAARYVSLGNALLRRLARERDAVLAEAADPFLDTPDWLADSWRDAYGETVAAPIALSHREEPPLDITVKQDPEHWAEQAGRAAAADRLDPPARTRQHHRACPASPRAPGGCRTPRPRCPSRLLAPQPGERVADLCAAPGGKTAQIAALGRRGHGGRSLGPAPAPPARPISSASA